MENFLLNLLLVSVITGVIILMLIATKNLFKNKYTIALKQILWIVLALRLIVPLNYSHTMFSTSVTQYKEEDVITFSTKTMTQQQEDAITYIAPLTKNDKPKKLLQPSAEAYQNAIQKKNNTTSQLLDKIVEFDENEKLLSQEKEKNQRVSMPYLFFQFIHFLQTHSAELLCVYLGGAALFFLLHFIFALALCLKKRKCSIKAEDKRLQQILKETADIMHIKRLPKLMWMEDIASPMAIGFFRYTILLPKENYQDKELRAIFTHELTHILHWDLRLKVLYLLANGLHWFNPLVYLMMQAACKDMELYCDYGVVATMNKKARMEYNELLLKILKNHRQKRMQSLLTTSFKGGVKEMKERFICNLDMRAKKYGVLPTCLTAIVIILSAGLFSLNVVEIDVKADEMQSFWLNHPINIEVDWRIFEQPEPSQDSDSPFLTFKAGDRQLPLAPRLSDDNAWQIPTHENDALGNVLVQYHNLNEAPVINALSAPPPIDIYCNNVKIEKYGVTLDKGWPNADVNQNPDFFREQAAKSQENPLFYVNSWSDIDGLFNIYFPEGQEPACVDVQDTVLNEDGSSRYPDYPFERIYRNSFINNSDSSVNFDLSDHYSIEVSENWTTYKELVHPYNRGYQITCYWNASQGMQSCVYSFIVRTQTTVYDEIINKYQTTSNNEGGE